MKPALHSRRQALSYLSAGSASLALGSCARSGIFLPNKTSPGTRDQFAWRLLAHYPEQATSLGIDTGDHAGLRSALQDKTPKGIERLASDIESDLENVKRALDTEPDKITQTSLSVVESAYSSALNN